MFKLHVKSSEAVSQRFHIIPANLPPVAPVSEPAPQILLLLKENIDQFNSRNAAQDAENKEDASSEESDPEKSDTTTDLDAIGFVLAQDYEDNALLGSVTSAHEESIVSTSANYKKKNNRALRKSRSKRNGKGSRVRQ